MDKVLHDKLTRKQLADAAGTGLEAIRFYEEKGLLPKPARGANGYRLYDQDTVRRLAFIQRAKDLGFTLQEIHELLELERHGSSRAELKGLGQLKLQTIRQKIADLQSMEAALEALVTSCNGSGPLAGCPIYEHITHEGCSHHREP
jgi:MerR family copper efflux transcriptional regulator